MDYTCCKFGDCSFSFGFIVLFQQIADRQTDIIKHTDAHDRYTTVGVRIIMHTGNVRFMHGLL